MLGIASFVGGTLLAAALLVVAGRKPQVEGPTPKPTALGWWTLTFGVTGLLAFALAVLRTPNRNYPGLGLWLISIAFSFAAVLVGMGTLIRRDGHWPTWVGLVAGLTPAVFWIALAVVRTLGFGE
jgi:hypothetical protein